MAFPQPEIAAPSSGVTAPVGLLLAGKLEPPVFGHARLIRPRLLSVLTRGIAHTPVTLISGPAGSGKTELAASWMQANADRRAVAWLSLDEADDDPGMFWTYVAEALSGAGVDLDGVPRPPAGEPVPPGFLTVLASRLLAGSRPVVLVLDNSDCLTHPDICRPLDALVRNAGRRLRLVLCARADPQLPLHQYRVSDSLTEIRRDSLAFTPEETRDLLARLGAAVPADVVTDLQARTEGWAVGVRLAAAPLKQGMDPEHLVASLADQDGSVAQYLFAEVLAHQPASVRRFLLRISVTPELWPALVERLTGWNNGRRMLASLAHANAFVEQSPHVPGGYRIHPVFREMLSAQLRYDSPQEITELHRVCAAWYREARDLPLAAAHAVEAGDWALVATLMVDDLRVATVLTRSADPSLRSLDGVPAGLPGRDAALVRLARTVPSRRPADPDDLAAVRAAARDEESRPALRACAAVTALAVASRDGAPWDAVSEDADAAELLVGLLPQNAQAQRRELAASIASSRAAALLRTEAGDEELTAGLRAALAASHAAHSSFLRNRLLGQFALLEALRGELRHAAELAEDGEAVAEDRGVRRAERYPAAAAAMAWVCMERYDHPAARRWVARVQACTEDPESLFVAPLVAVLQSRLLRVRHEFDAAGQLLQPYLQGAPLPRWIRTQVVAEQARLLLSAGADEAALRLLDPAGSAPWAVLLRATADVLAGRSPRIPSTGEDADLSPSLLVETELLQACRSAQAGNASAAVDTLRRALDRARPEQLRRPFFDAPPQVRRLLRGQPQLAGSAAWLDPAAPGTRVRPAAAPDEGATERAPEVLQPLSERELEVLRHLAEMLSTAEIAGAMFVSVNTVRTHIRSILRKLSVSRRNQAVRRGRELGLV